MVLASLIAMSLAQYKAAVRDRVRRHKQAVIALLLLMVPGAPALMTLSVRPLVNMFSEQGSDLSAWTSGGFVLLSLAWIGLQRDLLDDGPVAPVMMSLPFSRAHRLIRDVVVIAVVSTPWIALLGVACAISVIHTNAIGTITLLVGIVVTTLGAQLAWVRGRMAWVFMFVLGAVGIAWSGTPSVTIASTACVAWLLAKLPGAVTKSPATHMPKPWPVFRRVGGNWFSLDCQLLAYARQEGYRGSVPVLLCMAMAVVSVLLFGRSDATSRVGLILMFGGVASVVSSGGFAALLAMHREYAPFLDTLPAGHLSRKTAAVIAVAWPGMALSAMLAAISVFMDWNAWPALLVPAFSVVYGFAQFYMFSRMPRDAVAINLVLSSISTVAGIWLVAGASS